MKQKRLGRGLRGLIKSPDSQAPKPPTVQPVRPPAAEPAAADAPAPAESAAPDPVASRSAPPPTAAPAPAPVAPAAAGQGGLQHIPVADVRPNPFQPRSVFKEEDLSDLQASIDEHGVLQPVVVRKTELGYELIAGERRLRASKALGLDRIPAVVRQADDPEMQTLALVENLQRVDLNALEKAKALKAMMRNFELTQQEVADKVGKARTSISNLVRLLDLPVVIQDMVAGGDLSGSQARAVLLATGTDKRIGLAQRAAREGLTVRAIEKLATAERREKTAAEETADPYVRDLEERLRKALSTKVQLKPKGQGGAIEIRYHDANELDRLLELFGAE